MPLAVLDIGTNTVLLLVVSIDEHEAITVLHDEQRVIRAGEGIHHSKRISPDAEARLVATVRELNETARSQFGVNSLCAFGTSVFRRAENAASVVERVGAATGVNIEILSGDDEARWTFVGGTQNGGGGAVSCVIDIGGGSTEVVVGSGESLRYANSADIGVVVLREEFFPTLPTAPDAVAAARRSIIAHLNASAQSVRDLAPGVLVAVAGTPTTLAALELGLERYDAQRVDGTVLSRSAIDRRTEMLLNASLDALHALPCVDERRADVLPVGALILQTFMQLAGFVAVRVSDRGVRYGIALREWRKRAR